MPILTLLLACSTPEVEPSIEMPGFEGPSEPERKMEEAFDSLTTAFTQGLPSPISIRNAYESYMVNRDSNCPSMENQASTTWTGVWFDNCTSNLNYLFFGTSLFLEEFVEDSDDWYFLLIASFELADLNTVPFVGGGEVEYERNILAAQTNVTARIGGTWQHEPSGGWMAQSAEASVFYELLHSPDSSMLKIDGGVAYHDLQVSFTDMILDDSICDGIPQGRLRLRDDTGYWFRVDLSDCKPCGSVIWRDQTMEEVCIGDSLREAMLGLQINLLD